MEGKQIVTDKWETTLAMFVLSDWPLKVLIEGDDLFANACSMLPRLNLLCLLYCWANGVSTLPHAF